ncbi:MAG TPA: hypothetical protein PLW97_11790 [Synergistaceae bacterium]|nr:hypothetical protein [Synergistaceae bacterium]
MQFFGNNVFTGLFLGLCIAFYVFLSGYLKRRAQKKYWETHLAVISRGEEALKKQIDLLEKENRTLQKNMDALYRKPDRADRRSLYIYEKAIAILMEEYPGFAGVWGRATRRAEEEMEQAEGGRSRLAPRLKKFLGLMPSNSGTAPGKNLFEEEAAEFPQITAGKAPSRETKDSREGGTYTEGEFEEEHAKSPGAGSVASPRAGEKAGSSEEEEREPS